MAEAKPKNPKLVLLASLVPGAGHVVLDQQQRGLTFIFFMVILGWVSLRLMPETASFFSRHVGGVLIYGFSVLDAYRIAKVREIQYLNRDK